ncbi:MAG: nucleotidyltransferase family protein [Planctomycetota bacterium]
MDEVACARALLQVALEVPDPRRVGKDPGHALSTVGDAAWAAALDLAEEAGVLALLAHGLVRAGLLEGAPASARARFSAALVRQRAHDAARFGAFRALRVAGLDPLLLGDAALAARLHPQHPSSRQGGLEVLVEPEHVPQACAVLAERGLRRGAPGRDAVECRDAELRVRVRWALPVFEHLDVRGRSERAPAAFPGLGDARVLDPVLTVGLFANRLARGGLAPLLDLGLALRHAREGLSYPKIELALAARRDRCALLRAVEFGRCELGLAPPVGLRDVAAGLPRFTLEEVLRSRRGSPLARLQGALRGDRRRARAALRLTP